MRAKRLGLLTAMALVTLNIWTGAPLLAVWVGSRVAPQTGLSMSAVAVVAITLGAICFALIRLLGELTVRYDEVTGRPVARHQTAWLRSARGERAHASVGEASHLRAQDYAVVGAAIAGWLAFEIWFLFFAGSSLPAP